jgi:hypothetical protein
LAALLCIAGIGYDGPCGAGSISGQIVSGGPGIGGPPLTDDEGNASYVSGVAGTSVGLVGGVYTNNEATAYEWQYGTTTGYSHHTAPVAVSAGATPDDVHMTLTGLAPHTTYHFRLVAANASATSYGYDFTFTTGAAAKVKTTSKANKKPTISGLKQSSTKWIEKKPKARKHPSIGTTFSFTLNEQAQVTLTFRAGTLTVTKAAGADRIAFSGKLTNGHKLKVGSYSVTVTAKANGETTTSKRLNFKILTP